MRICLYTNTAFPATGGQEVVVDALARQFIAQGHEPVVLAPRPKHFWFLHDKEMPYPVIRHPRFYSMRRMVDWYRWWILKAYRRYHFDVLHCHGIYPSGYLASLCRERLQIPIVLTSHGGDVYADNPRLSDPILAPRHLQALEKADALIAISRFAREGYERMCPAARRIVDIPNGMAVDSFAAPAPRPAGLDPAIRAGEYFLFIGRLVPRKGVDVALRALATLPPSRNVQLVVAGDGKERSCLEQLAASLNLTERVRFVGRQFGSAKSYLLQNSRCVVVPSRNWEAFGLVVLEGYAAGRPVIASRLVGMAELVEPGRTGWLVTPDSVEDLARTFQQILDAPQQCDLYGLQVRQFVQDFDWPRIAAAYLDVYAQAVRARTKVAA